jgi:disulfide bond formation protein DsbB
LDRFVSRIAALMRNQRLMFLAIFLGCAGLLGFGIYLQQVKYLLPCPLCVVQRIAFWLVGLTALVGFLHNPASGVRRVYGAMIALFALVGAAVAVHHAMIIRHPEAFGCSISPEEKFLNSLPIAKWWPTMFEANGDCARVTWSFLSLAIPDWALICFVLIAGLAIYLLVARQRT